MLPALLLAWLPALLLALLLACGFTPRVPLPEQHSLLLLGAVVSPDTIVSRWSTNSLPPVDSIASHL